MIPLSRLEKLDDRLYREAQSPQQGATNCHIDKPINRLVDVLSASPVQRCCVVLVTKHSDIAHSQPSLARPERHLACAIDIWVTEKLTFLLPTWIAFRVDPSSSDVLLHITWSPLFELLSDAALPAQRGCTFLPCRSANPAISGSIVPSCYQADADATRYLERDRLRRSLYTCLRATLVRYLARKRTKRSKIQQFERLIPDC